MATAAQWIKPVVQPAALVEARAAMAIACLWVRAKIVIVAEMFAQMDLYASTMAGFMNAPVNQAVHATRMTN